MIELPGGARQARPRPRRDRRLPRRRPRRSPSRSPSGSPARTTVSVERSVTRLLGVDGADDLDAPLPNVLVDHVHDRGELGRGHRLLARQRDAADRAHAAADRRGASARGELDLLRAASAPRRARSASACTQECAARLREISAALRRAPRRCASGSASSPPPLRYVLTATGDVYEDVVHAQAVARGRRGHRRGDPLDRAEPARLRPLRPHDRGLRRHVRHAGQLPHHARGDGRVVRAARPLRAPVELLLGPVHVGDRRDGRVGGLRQHGQRRPLRDPLPRHQHRARPDRPARLADDQRLLRRRHQHRRGQLPAHRRRDRGRAVGDRLAVHQPPARAATRACPTRRSRSATRSRSTCP